MAFRHTVTGAGLERKQCGAGAGWEDVWVVRLEAVAEETYSKWVEFKCTSKKLCKFFFIKRFCLTIDPILIMLLELI